MSSAIIYDNYLSKTSFSKLKNFMTSTKVPWEYNNHKVGKDETNDSFQFVHCFYRPLRPQYGTLGKIDPSMPIIHPLINKLKASLIIKIKANLTPRTSVPEITDFHTDFSPILGNSTGIFYINTNNGYTEFEDGTIVESVANRAVFFKGSERHRGVSCTDEKIRVVINLNFFPEILT